MQYSSNYNFNLPEPSDQADIAKINENFEAIDAKVWHYTFTQSTAATVWSITHNLNCYPSVTVVDSSGAQVVGEVRYMSKNAVVLTFTAAFTGRAYLF